MSGLLFFDYARKLHPRGNQQVSFQAARQQATGDPRYEGFIADNGDPIIMERTLADTSNITIKYYYGKASTEDFATAWAARAAKTFVEFNELFN